MRRLYRALLRCYPRSFRERYGRELQQVFDEDRARAAARGQAVLAFWAGILGDLLVSAGRQRLRQARSAYRRFTGQEPPHLPPSPRRSEMDTILQDVRYALRQFARRPGFTAIAVLSLALGIGGNTLIYGLVDGFVLTPFPYPDPGRLVAVGVNFPKLSSDVEYVEVLSPAEYADIRGMRSLAQTAAFDLGNRNVSGGDMPERVFTALLLDDLFPVFGMRPALGRGFTREELGPNGPRVAIISYRLWQSRFGGDPAILARPVRIGGESASVVGVMPPGLLVIGTDLWIPWGADPSSMPRNVRQFTVVGRLAPGTTAAQANAELATLTRRVEQSFAAEFKEYQGWRLQATPWGEALLQDLRPAAFLLLGAVSVVLLIACANLANLTLARASTRSRELAVRLALGAARSRLVRQLLTESLLVSIAGGAVGLAVAALGFRGAAALLPSQIQTLDLQAGVNPRVLIWCAAISIAAGILVGVLPALHATRTDPHESLKADGRSGAGPSGGRSRSILVVAEVALAVLLMMGAVLLIRSFLNVSRIEPGFDPKGVLTMRLTLPREKYQGEAANVFFDQLMERIAGGAGVRGVAAASQFPPMGAFETQFTLERDAEPTSVRSAVITVTSPGYFDVLRVPVRRGRPFSPADRLDAPPVAIVNEAFASRFLQGADPVGARIRLGDPSRPRPWATIVGVTGDTRNSGPTRPVRPEIFMPMRQQTAWNQLFVLVRGDMDTAALLASVRSSVRALDPEQPVYAIRTLEQAIAESTAQQRIAAILLGIFADIALVLAAIGIFGVMSYSVSARMQEMGVRLAVGAEPRDLRWLVMRHVLRLAGTGLAIGTALLIAAGKALTGLLVGVTPTDPATIAAVALVLGLVAAVAGWIPAARASRVDPIAALRNE